IGALEAASGEASTEGLVVSDLSNLASTVAAVAGDSPIIFVASPSQAITARLYLGANSSFEIFASSGLSDGVVIAIATNALATAADAQPRFSVSKEALASYNDTSPGDISADATT